MMSAMEEGQGQEAAPFHQKGSPRHDLNGLEAERVSVVVVEVEEH